MKEEKKTQSSFKSFFANLIDKTSNPRSHHCLQSSHVENANSRDLNNLTVDFVISFCKIRIEIIYLGPLFAS